MQNFGGVYNSGDIVLRSVGAWAINASRLINIQPDARNKLNIMLLNNGICVVNYWLKLSNSLPTYSDIDILPSPYCPVKKPAALNGFTPGFVEIIGPLAFDETTIKDGFLGLGKNKIYIQTRYYNMSGLVVTGGCIFVAEKSDSFVE